MPDGVDVEPSGGVCTPTSGDPCTWTYTLGVASSTVPGNYPITVTGTPNDEKTTFNLDIEKSPDVIPTCSVSPNPAAIGDTVTWTATPSGGSGTGYKYSWSGDGIPESPEPTTQSVSTIYSTTGTKSVTVKVKDSIDNAGSYTCTGLINFNPKFQEF
jgi:hypothetical protein